MNTSSSFVTMPGLESPTRRIWSKARLTARSLDVGQVVHVLLLPAPGAEPGSPPPGRTSVSTDGRRWGRWSPATALWT
jgi:hypothetical protein